MYHLSIVKTTKEKALCFTAVFPATFECVRSNVCYSNLIQVWNLPQNHEPQAVSYASHNQNISDCYLYADNQKTNA